MNQDFLLFLEILNRFNAHYEKVPISLSYFLHYNHHCGVLYIHRHPFKYRGIPIQS